MAAKFGSMRPRSFHKLARFATTVMTIAAAAFGAFAGVIVSGWGAILVIVPVGAAVFGIFGALVGGAIEGALRMRFPTDYEI